MAQDLSAKKTAYISAVVANALAMKSARDQYTVLKEQWTADATIAAMVDADCVGPNAHLTKAILGNYINNGVPINDMLTNVAVSTVNRLPNLLAVLPT